MNMNGKKKPAKLATKPRALSFDEIGGAIPPPPTEAEMKAARAARQGRGSTLYMPGSAKARATKPAAKPKITGFRSRRKMLDEVMGG